MGEDPNLIRADIERTRAEMGDTVEAIGYKADVKSRAKDRISDTKDRLTGKVSDATPDGQQVSSAANRAAITKAVAELAQAPQVASVSDPFASGAVSRKLPVPTASPE